MSAYQLLQMLSYAFHFIGLVVCILGLTLARRPAYRWLGRGLAVLGFLIAISPLLAQLFGLVEPVPVGSLPPQ
jgi:hypothetical protein